MSSVESRVAAVEAKIDELNKDRDTVRRERREDLHKIFASIEEVRIKLASAPPPCPVPGMCIGLGESLKKHDERLAAVQTYIDQQRGGWKFMGGLLAAAGACGGAIAWMMSSLGIGHK